MKIGVICFGPIESKSNGYCIRTYHIVNSLSADKDVTVFEFAGEARVHSLDSNPQYFRLKTTNQTENVVHRLIEKSLTFDPFRNAKFQISSFFKLLKYRSNLRDCEVIFIEWPLLPAGFIIANAMGCKTILDTHCINKKLARDFKEYNYFVYLLRATLWDLLERFAMKVSDHIIFVSEDEKQFSVKEYGINEKKTSVIPNVVDIPSIKGNEAEVKLVQKDLRLENKKVATFIGDLNSVQNRDCVEYIIDILAPKISETDEDIVFIILGKGKAKFSRKLSNVSFTGFVEDLDPYLELTDICIAPLRVGAGTKTKVLDYMVHGKPVLTKKIGVEGLDVKEVKSVVVCELNDFPENLIKMMNETPIHNGEVTKELIIKKYSPKVLNERLHRLLEEIA
jgi:glycosyltransferase involved in cell wall biosynthesis